ncbi:MAG: hypothetical protein ABW202_15310 [Duganella sp.]
MLSLEDKKWQELHGGYHIPYDASIVLRSMEEDVDGWDDAWDELWNELHHQGDVGIASYAAIPQLVRIASTATARGDDFYSLISTIEVARHRHGNPALPEWLKADYDSAWVQASAFAKADLDSSVDSGTIPAILSVLALAKGELKLGAMLSGMHEDELDEWLEERFGWSEVYA